MRPPQDNRSSCAAFPKSRRLLRSIEFKTAQSRGRRVTSEWFVFVVSPRGDDEPARLGVTASRKVGNSVRRSRLKRLVREAFRLHPDWFPPGVDLVVICKKDDPAIALGVVEADFRKVSRRVHEAGGRTKNSAGARPPLQGGARNASRTESSVSTSKANPRLGAEAGPLTDSEEPGQ